jgi:hypothetical protein
MILNDRHSTTGKNAIYDRFKGEKGLHYMSYDRLLPHRSNSIDGKKHVRTVPVRLRKAQNDEHSKHEGINRQS